jgi:hypothetical protein
MREGVRRGSHHEPIPRTARGRQDAGSQERQETEHNQQLDDGSPVSHTTMCEAGGAALWRVGPHGGPRDQCNRSVSLGGELLQLVVSDLVAKRTRAQLQELSRMGPVPAGAFQRQLDKPTLERRGVPLDREVVP